MKFYCDQVAELLPWYLNGTLDERDQREVRLHLEGCEPCRQALEETRLAGRIYGQHVPAEALVALAWGETPEGIDPDLLERHLESCPECAAELEMVRTSRRLEEDDRVALFPSRTTVPRTPAALPRWRAAALAAGLAGLVVVGGWVWTAGRARSLDEQLARASRPTSTAPQAPTTAAPAGADRDRLAAMTAEVERLRKSEVEMRAKEGEIREQLTRLAEAGPVAPSPQINAWISDLRPTSDVVRGGGAGNVYEVPVGTAAGLILLASHPETHRDHRIEIVDGTGGGSKTVWSAEGLRRNPKTDDFSVTLPAGSLKPGTYTIRISAEEGGKRVDLESYAIRVK
jgi:anti-sigma factor RsiW